MIGKNSLKSFKLLPQIQTENGFMDALFLLDGAPAHFSKEAREWLDTTFPNRWIGRGSEFVQWPPRSPDLTPLDFFFWGFVKGETYKYAPKTLNQLKESIKTAFDSVTPFMLQNTRKEFELRLRHIIVNGGQHFEQWS